MPRPTRETDGPSATAAAAAAASSSSSSSSASLGRTWIISVAIASVALVSLTVPMAVRARRGRNGAAGGGGVGGLDPRSFDGPTAAAPSPSPSGGRSTAPGTSASPPTVGPYPAPPSPSTDPTSSRRPSLRPSSSSRPSSSPSAADPAGRPTSRPPPSGPSRGPTPPPSPRPTPGATEPATMIGRPSSSPSPGPSSRSADARPGKDEERPAPPPSPAPTPGPTVDPAARPTERPAIEPTGARPAPPPPPPTSTSTSTGRPTRRPTSPPTERPEERPTGEPTAPPTERPTGRPTADPTGRPTPLPSDAPSAAPTLDSVATFYAVADTPYSDDEYMILASNVAALPPDAEFLIHLGDVKSSSMPCTRNRLRMVDEILRTSPAPVFIIPGDNEWNDCPDPDDAWGLWEGAFMRYDERYWDHGLDVSRQPNRTENFSFELGRALFVGLNIVGGRVHSGSEWEERHASNLDWTVGLIEARGPGVGAVVIFGHANPWDEGGGVLSQYGQYFGPLRRYLVRTLKNSVPVLYLNGDGHEWIYEPNMMGMENSLRVQLQGHSEEAPTGVRVDGGRGAAGAGAEEVFSFQRWGNGIGR